VPEDRIWWQLRKVEQDRAILLRIGDDPRSQELLPLVEAEIARLWAFQVRLRYPDIFKAECEKAGGASRQRPGVAWDVFPEQLP
jgi:hypothetical protein